MSMIRSHLLEPKLFVGPSERKISLSSAEENVIHTLRRASRKLILSSSFEFPTRSKQLLEQHCSEENILIHLVRNGCSLDVTCFFSGDPIRARMLSTTIGGECCEYLPIVFCRRLEHLSKAKNPYTYLRSKGLQEFGGITAHIGNVGLMW